MHSRIARLLLMVCWASITGAQISPFVTESRQDLDIAIDNFPEKVRPGNEIPTIFGTQITPGTVPRDFRINQQIYDDLAIVAENFTNLKRMVFDLPIHPTTFGNLELAMNRVLQLLTELGIRYNITPNFSSIRTELVELQEQLRTIPLNSEVNTTLMVPYNRLDVIKAEIENLLKTKIVGT